MNSQSIASLRSPISRSRQYYIVRSHKPRIFVRTSPTSHPIKHVFVVFSIQNLGKSTTAHKPQHPEVSPNIVRCRTIRPPSIFSYIRPFFPFRPRPSLIAWLRGQQTTSLFQARHKRSAQTNDSFHHIFFAQLQHCTIHSRHIITIIISITPYSKSVAWPINIGKNFQRFTFSSSSSRDLFRRS